MSCNVGNSWPTPKALQHLPLDGQPTLSRQGPLGAAGLLFTPAAMILADTVLALPLMAGVTTAAVMGVDPAIREGAVIDGASPRHVGLILLREAQFLEGISRSLRA